MSEQLDLFRQPAEPEPKATESEDKKPRLTQMTELPGETWEDAFGRKDAA